MILTAVPRRVVAYAVPNRMYLHFCYSSFVMGLVHWFSQVPEHETGRLKQA